MPRLFAVVALLALVHAPAALAAPCAGFTDVDTSSPFCVNVAWIKNRGVTQGCTATEYCPNADVTRLQMAAFMARLGEALFPSTCGTGQVMKWNGTAWACATDATTGAGGTVSSITAGTGLTGGTITSSGTIAVDAAYVQRRVAASCAAGSSIRAIAADGSVTCESDDAGATNAYTQGGNSFAAPARLGTTDNHQLDLIANNISGFRVEPHAVSPNVIAGFVHNAVYPGVYGVHIGGGGASGNSYSNLFCAYAFGCHNSATDHFSTIGGGLGNLAGDTDAVLSNRQFDTVGGGFNNAAGGGASTVGGGFSNQALGGSSTVPGGEDNRAIGNYSTAFGVGSRAGEASVAMGNNAYATHAGSFVFSDNTFVRTSTGAPNQFIARARGGVYFFTGGTNDANYTGAYLPTGGTAWVVYSDRDGKKGVASVDPEDVLRKLAAMPISTWQWNAEPGSVRHMGPMAQDFHAAFGLGTTPKGIATVDADGVALAAIQGLNAKLETKLAEANSQIAELRRAMAALAARVDATR